MAINCVYECHVVSNGTNSILTVSCHSIAIVHVCVWQDKAGSWCSDSFDSETKCQSPPAVQFRTQDAAVNRSHCLLSRQYRYCKHLQKGTILSPAVRGQ